MTTPIHPKALRSFRDRKHWTQEQLTEATKGKNKVSLPTIKRIESTKDGTYPANDRVAESLAKALGVTVDDLSKPPTDEAEQEALLQKHGYRQLRTTVDAETNLAFEMVSLIYNIPTRSQIIMAPLFAALLAEASLAWRRDRVAEIDDATSRLKRLCSGHLSFVEPAYRMEEGASQERESIEDRDLFGKYVSDDAFDGGYDPSRDNPFANFLDHFAKPFEAGTIEIRRGSGWKTPEGMPKYRIGADLISELTGGDPDTGNALRRGDVRLKDVFDDLLGPDNIARILAGIPQAVSSVISKVDDGLANFPETPNKAKES